MAAVGDMYSEGNEDATVVELKACSSCGRNFNPQVLGRHLPICEKTKSKQRSVFNTAKQRAEGTEIAQPPSKPATKSQTKQIPQKASNWRVQHAEFVRTIRAARSTQNAIAAGKPLPPPPPPAANPGAHVRRRVYKKCATSSVSAPSSKLRAFSGTECSQHMAAPHRLPVQYGSTNELKTAQFSSKEVVQSSQGNVSSSTENLPRGLLVHKGQQVQRGQLVLKGHQLREGHQVQEGHCAQKGQLVQMGQPVQRRQGLMLQQQQQQQASDMMLVNHARLQKMLSDQSSVAMLRQPAAVMSTPHVSSGRRLMSAAERELSQKISTRKMHQVTVDDASHELMRLEAQLFITQKRKADNKRRRMELEMENLAVEIELLEKRVALIRKKPAVQVQ